MLMDFFHRKCSRFSNFRFPNTFRNSLKIYQSSENPRSPTLLDINRRSPHLSHNFCYGFLIRFSNLLASIQVQNLQQIYETFCARVEKNCQRKWIKATHRVSFLRSRRRKFVFEWADLKKIEIAWVYFNSTFFVMKISFA